MQTHRVVMRRLEISGGPPLFAPGEAGAWDEEARRAVVELCLHYRWTGAEWECFSAEAKARVSWSTAGAPTYRTRLYDPWRPRETPPWVARLVALHRPAAVAAG